MNRNQRRLGRMHQNRYYEKKLRYERQERPENQEKTDWQERQLRFDRDRHTRCTDIEEVLPPKARRNLRIADRFAANKCCYVTPKKEDFAQLTDSEVDKDLSDKYSNMIEDLHGTDTIKKLKELRKVLCNNVSKVENSSQWVCDKNLSSPKFTEESEWQNVDTVDEIDQYLCENEGLENIHICEIPHIKIIARKYSRFRKNNVELRKLDEKVVCVEYDVFVGDAKKPKQKLRAFFSIKPHAINSGQEETKIPSKVKHNFNISDADLKKLNEKEVEIIDDKVSENKVYLADLKRILRGKQAIDAKKNRDTLDLLSLYKMAKRERCIGGEYTGSILSDAELQEMKELILSKCASSVHGICRRTVKSDLAGGNIGVISQSIMAELLRDSVNE